MHVRRSFLLLVLAASPVLAQLDTAPLRTRREARVYKALVNKLNQTRVTVDWKDVTLGEALNDLRRQTRVNFVITRHVDGEAEVLRTVKLRNVQASAVLGLLQSDEVVFQNRYGVIFVTSREDATKRAGVLRIYSIHDLLYVPPDFPGPKIGLRGSGSDIEEAEEPPEREQNDPEQIIDLIKSATGEKNWETDGVSIQAIRGKLVVRHTPGMQRKVSRFLNQLHGVF